VLGFYSIITHLSTILGKFVFLEARRPPEETKIFINTLASSISNFPMANRHENVFDMINIPFTRLNVE
jgi:hypothetical protein